MLFNMSILLLFLTSINLIINAFSRATSITRTLRGHVENLFNVALLARFDWLAGLIATEGTLFEELNQARVTIQHAPGTLGQLCVGLKQEALFTEGNL